MSEFKSGKKTPCAECPFGRKVKPGALGGSPPRVYIGQSVGPFWLPCHMSKGYDEETKTDHEKHEQCAGAAMYRHLVGVAERLPRELLRLEGDPDLVFSSHAEFLSHHSDMTLAEAEALLEKIVTPEALMQLEMIRLRSCPGARLMGRK